MSLFGSLHLGASAIGATAIALEVTGNNIANVATPGFIREELDLAPITPDRFGALNIGRGVTPTGVFQKIDRFLAERARAAASESQAGSTRAALLRRVEGLFNELSDGDLSTLITQFFASIQNVQNRPNDPAVRRVVVEQGALLAQTIRGLRAGIDNIRNDVSSDVLRNVDAINELVGSIRELNVQIIAAEATGGEAGALRSIRAQRLSDLSERIEIRVIEQENGAVNIFTGNDFLLFAGQIQEVAAIEEPDRGVLIQRLVLADSTVPVPATAGRLGGAQRTRDGDIAAVVDALDALTRALIFEFNRIHSSGQGLGSFTQITATNRVLDPTSALDTDPAGLVFRPTNGSFEIRVTDPATNQIRTTVIDVDLDGTAAGDSLDALAAKLDAVLGAGAATVNAQGRLEIQAPAGVEFTFANDTSGVLAALGLNTFFTGQDSRNIDVNALLRENPELFAASRAGQAGDTSNAIALSQFADRSLAALGGSSLDEAFADLIGQLGTHSETARIGADVLEATRSALESENLAITGVSLDEEAVRLITFQRGLQASARFVSVVNELLDEIINLGA
jgi:flagellar hook-associated protein 1 FlgK